MNGKTVLKEFTQTRILIITLIILLILVPLNVFWNLDRMNEFQARRTEYQETQTFSLYHMDQGIIPGQFDELPDKQYSPIMVQDGTSIGAARAGRYRHNGLG